jgi:hypothetical protein
MNTWEERLAAADVSAREPRRAFDVADGLRRLAADAGYVQPPQEEPRVSTARRQLEVVARWATTQAGAAGHIKDLTMMLGQGVAPASFDGWTDDVDVDGMHVYACVLYLAHHPESAKFWWQLAAGAGHSGAAYCLYLHHLSFGEIREARHWKSQMQSFFGASDYDAFLTALERFAGYTVRHRPPSARATARLAAEMERIAQRTDHCGLVGRPDPQLAARMSDLAVQS